jgi:hypothetical protein
MYSKESTEIVGLDVQIKIKYHVTLYSNSTSFWLVNGIVKKKPLNMQSIIVRKDYVHSFDSFEKMFVQRNVLLRVF